MTNYISNYLKCLQKFGKTVLVNESDRTYWGYIRKVTLKKVYFDEYNIVLDFVRVNELTHAEFLKLAESKHV